MNRPLFGKLAAGAVAAALAISSLIASPALAAEPEFSREDTVSLGTVNRDLVLDEDKQRLYVAVDRGQDENGAIAWLNTSTQTAATETFELNHAEPSVLASSADGSQLYVAHYRNAVFSIVDTNTGQVQEITGGPKYPGGIVVDPKTDKVYLYDSKAIYVVDAETLTMSDPIQVSSQRYPLIKALTYDPTNNVLWVAEGREKVLTALNLSDNSWDSSTQIPLSSHRFGDTEVGGRATLMALDESHGLLHIVMSPTLGEDWTNDRVITFDTNSREIVGENYIEIGENGYEARVNPVTSELLVTNGFSNQL